MGKHDKIDFTWSEASDSFHVAENRRLQTENERLRAEIANLKNTIRALERDIARSDRTYDSISGKMDDAIAAKDAEIAMLNLKILKLVRDHV